MFVKYSRRSVQGLPRILAIQARLRQNLWLTPEDGDLRLFDGPRLSLPAMADPRLLLLVPDGVEKQALLSALESRLELRSRNRLPKDLSDCDLLWIHRGPEDALEAPCSEEFTRIRDFVERGGRLLLTGSPAGWTGELGVEDRPPEIRDATWQGPIREEERLGLAPFLGHPLFERFPGGLYLRKPRAGASLGGAWYENGERPVQGRILAVEKVHLGIDARRGLLIEHHLGEGRILSLGAHLVFSDPVSSDSTAPDTSGADPFRESRLRFVGDLVDDLLSTGQEARGRSWPEPMGRESAWRLQEQPLEELLEFAPTGLERFDRESFRMEPEPAPESFYDIVGNRGDLLLGAAGVGPKELWHLPLRVFRDHALLIDGQVGDLTSWSLWPFAASRKIRSGAAVVQEYWTVGRAETGAACSYRLLEGEESCVEIGFTCDSRMLWPYPVGALGDLLVRRDRAGCRMEICDESGTSLICMAWSRAPRACTFEDVGGEGGLRIHVEFDLTSGGEDSVEVLYVAGLDADATRQRMQSLVSGESDLVAEVLAEERSRETRGFSIDLGDPILNEEIAWIREKGRDFFQQTEHLWEEEDCAGYVAGFQGTQPGWCSGRPGLAWYFGRDGISTARQSLLWGDREEVVAQLRLLARHQGPDGQILHELTPSGTLHYDALDATPMFVSLLARYLAWTGDRSLVVELFPAVERALFGQLLPHSREVGRLMPGRSEHAWIEDGPLRENLEADLSLACHEVEALTLAVWMAECLEKEELAQRIKNAATEAAEALRSMFKDPESGLHASVLGRDGSKDCGDGSGEPEAKTETDPEAGPLTALSVLPFLLGLEDHAGSALPTLALERHAADWGHRFLDSLHPRFDPESYQGGSVWPLISGWVAKADFASGRSEQAWAGLRGQLSLVRHFAPGVIEEAYAGDTFLPAGVCAHQAWSHAALLATLTEGLLGLGTSPDGLALCLRPSLPAALPEIRFERLKYRDLILTGRIRRDAAGLDIQLQVRGEGEGALDLAAFFPRPARFLEAQLDGETILVEACEREESLLIQADRIQIRAGQDLEVHISVETDLELEPPCLLPLPGSRSTRARLVSRRLDGPAGLSAQSDLTLLVEGPEGEQAWPMQLGQRGLERIDGAEFRDGELHFHLEASTSGYGSKEIRMGFGALGEDENSQEAGSAHQGEVDSGSPA